MEKERLKGRRGTRGGYAKKGDPLRNQGGASLRELVFGDSEVTFRRTISNKGTDLRGCRK